MTRSAAKHRAWMIPLIAAWAVVATLSGLQAALWGWGGLIWGTTLPGPDAYPEVRWMFGIEFDPAEAAIVAGDVLVAVDGRDLRGLAPWEQGGVLYPVGEGRLWEWSRYRDAALADQTRTFEYLRDGESRSVRGSYGGDPYSGFLWFVAMAWGLVGAFVGLRAPDSRSARATLVLAVFIGFFFSRFYFGVDALLLANSMIIAVGATGVGALFLRWALVMPDEAAPRARWPYWLVWLIAPVAFSAAILWLTGVALGHEVERARLNDAAAVLVVLATPAILIRNYRVSGPVGRRQLKWLVLAFLVWGLAESVQYVAQFLWWELRASTVLMPFRLMALTLLPIAIGVAILRFNLFDIDRVLSATTAFGIAAAVPLLAAALAVSFGGAAVGSALGVADATGQLVVLAVAGALMVPTQRVARPWVERALFRERVALAQGFDELVADLAAVDSRRGLWQTVGQRLEELLHPDSLVVYARGGSGFARAYSSGGSAGEGQERALVEALAARSTPLARARGGRRRRVPISAFERAALETLRAEVVLPLRRRGGLEAFVSLGAKRSGDVYTETDLALLGSLADKASLKLAEFEEEPAQERHLAAIVSADVVGYSRHMSLDERATIETIAARRELVDRIAREHHGRMVDFVGDSFLAEFPSALDATGCALEIQRAVDEENGSLPEERRMLFRLGVHVGDVTARGGRIYGDGVNVAARLEALAEPGGICVSAVVHEEVAGKVRATHEDLGEREVKNIPRPIRVYRLRR